MGVADVFTNGGQEHLGTWRPWSPDEVRDRLHGLTIPWFVAGGWALDLWRGRQSRSHDDIEIAIPRKCFVEMRKYLNAFRHFLVCDGRVHALDENCVLPLDRHQIRILDETLAWRLDVFLEPGDEDTWVYRRDESVRRLRSEMMSFSSSGVPYLKPEGVLLFKAKPMHEKDEADFTACVPLMREADRLWLKGTLEKTHPGHPWTRRLVSGAAGSGV